MKTSTAIQRDFMSPNLSFSDRQFRFVIGASMVAAGIIVTPETMGMWSIVLLASIPFITMSITGWDPLYAILGKSTRVEGEEDIQQRSWTCPNVGTIDRAVRFSIGLMLLASLLTMTTMQADMVFTLLAIPLIVTAITAWDPFYAALGTNSFASRIDVEAAEPDASEQTLGACYIFPHRQRTSADLSRAA
ncbi:YgaP family membrane protein [Kaarinaea lacus]